MDANESNTSITNTNFSITPNESVAIDQKVDFELHDVQCKMIKIGGTVNLLAGIFVVWVLYPQLKLSFLLAWYGTLVLANVFNIISAFYYQSHKPSPTQINSRLRIYHFLLALLCTTWGLVGILFTSNDLSYQLFIIAFLLVALVCFGFGTITDFVASVVGISFLTIPSIVFHIYLAIHNTKAIGYDANLSLASAISIFIAASFILIICFIGHRLIKKSFRLTFINVELSEKLKNANKFLEQRVKERTVELEESLNLVKYQATHDLLTRLPNERLLEEYIETEIKLAEQDSHMFAVLFVGLNEMDKINDGLGHHATALVVQMIAKRLKQFFNKNEQDNLANFKFTLSLSRRDEFVILLNPLFELETLEDTAAPLFSILDEPIYINEKPIKLTASVGISVYPKDGQDVRSLLMNADAAMRTARRWGGNKVIIYKSEINADVSKQLEIESYLHNALKNNEFRVHYQPFVSLVTGQICGMEALLRWKSPILGFISPMDFIPLAEANGLILQIGEWVLRSACSQIKAWHVQGFGSLKMAINLSAKQLQQEGIVEIVAGILEELKLDSQYIELELTETTAFQEESIPIIKQFKAMGIALSVDDFGTGYSGLTNLKLFKIDKLKIDKYFVQDVDMSSDSRTIVSTTIALAKKMGINVLAEGVETEAQLKFLRENDCDMIQGYYFSPPIAADAFTELLLNGQSLSLDDKKAL